MKHSFNLSSYLFYMRKYYYRYIGSGVVGGRGEYFVCVWMYITVLVLVWTKYVMFYAYITYDDYWYFFAYTFDIRFQYICTVFSSVYILSTRNIFSLSPFLSVRQ